MLRLQFLKQDSFRKMLTCIDSLKSFAKFMKAKFDGEKQTHRRMVWTFPKIDKLQAGIFDDVNNFLIFDNERKKIDEQTRNSVKNS